MHLDEKTMDWMFFRQQLSKAIKDANFKPHGGDWNLAVGEVSA